MRRRALLGSGLTALAAPLAGCDQAAPLQGGWVGTSPARGHRLRSGAVPPATVQRRAQVLVVGGGIAGLAAARAFSRAGIDDVQLLELEDQPGGNSRGHVLAGQPCPLGAHYLPLPGPHAHAVSEWLHEIGLLRQHLGRTVADERHLCHSPQERLWIDGAWAGGLLPPAEPGSATLAQVRRFAQQVADAQRIGFAMPTLQAPWTAAHAALDSQTFAAWLDAAGLDDPRLRWYLDHCCRDDYGAPAAVVSAWAGLHYFASRHGFHAPGDDAAGDDGEPVFTWPEGNAWLVQRLAAPLAGRLHGGRTVLRVEETRHGVQVLAWDDARQQAEAWTVQQVVLALPLFVAARVLQNPPDALRQAAAALPHAPWLVANLQLSAPLLDRPGAPPSWDSVVYGSSALGYVDAGHQRLDPRPTAPVLTAYEALPPAQRGALLADDWRPWAAQVVQHLAGVHPDLPAKLLRVDLARHGHAMAVPVPGQRTSAAQGALAALRAQRGRLRFAHADLSAYSVFEEAFTLGTQVAGAARRGG